MSTTDALKITANRDVTGRDGYIKTKALGVAATALMAEPFPGEFEADDMRAILDALSLDGAESELARLRYEDGLAMGLTCAGRMTITAEDVEAWLASELKRREPTELLVVNAIAEVGRMTGHLYGVTPIKGLSDLEARERLHTANASLRVLSGRTPHRHVPQS